MARLSTHVLDTAHGVPAAGVRIDLHRLDADGRTHVATATTNADGRTSEPLLAGETMPTGVYELTFHAGRYLRDRGVDLGELPFCLLYTSPSPRDLSTSRMPSSA